MGHWNLDSIGLVEKSGFTAAPWSKAKVAKTKHYPRS